MSGDLSIALRAGSNLVTLPAARRGMDALRQGRVSDVRIHAASLAQGGTSLELFWSALLEGLLLERENRPDLAVIEFRRAAEHTEACTEGGPSTAQDKARLGAIAMEHGGRALRRQEQLKAALDMHAAAYELRINHGREEERWESACSAALDVRLLGQVAATGTWYARALKHARDCDDGEGLHSAMTRGARVLALLQFDQLESALADARQAADYWRVHSPCSLEAAHAELIIARILVRQAETWADDDPAAAAPLLTEAHGLLETVQESLLAFGLAAAGDGQLAGELLDFVSRLNAMASPTSEV